MSLGTLFDRINSDVATKLAAGADVQSLAVSLAGNLYYMPDIQFNRFLILYLQTSLQQLRTQDARDAVLLALYVRRIVATAVASPMNSILIESKYLALFA